MFMPQYDWISDIQDNILIDFVGRFEQLQDDYAYVCEQVGRKPSILPHEKKTVRNHYRDYYDRETVAVIQMRFAKDILAFGYVY